MILGSILDEKHRLTGFGHDPLDEGLVTGTVEPTVLTVIKQPSRKVLNEAEDFIAQPSHPLHILIVPKRPYANLLDVPPDAADFMRDLFETAQSLVRQFGLDQSGYRLIVNGGAYQDVPHLHFHLVSEKGEE